jgi:ABC-type Fe3+/spermidine/putrescine transport system ATPase subunit
MPLLKVTNVGKKGPGDFELKNITFSQNRNENIAIAGETGAGKSTLLKLVAGLIQPDGGELLFGTTRISGPSDRLVPGHPGIAYLSQHFELQKSLRVEQVLAYSNTLSDAEADRLYAVCQIDHLLKRRTDELSGGEKQRVAICRLLISSPQLLLLDEPFSHLDMVHKNTLKAVIRDIGEKLKITCMLVSHDPQDTLSWADKIIVMRDGKIIQKGSPQLIYQQPVDEYTGGMFGNYNIVRQESFKTFAQLKTVKKTMLLAPGKAIFIRPEQFRIVKKSGSALRGRVEKILYYGNFSEVEITVRKKRLIVRTSDHELRQGQVVYISVYNQDLWTI